jgi:hypothetical protein
LAKYNQINQTADKVIGDQLDSGSTLENIFPEAAKMFLIERVECQRIAYDKALSL